MIQMLPEQRNVACSLACKIFRKFGEFERLEMTTVSAWMPLHFS